MKKIILAVALSCLGLSARSNDVTPFLQDIQRIKQDHTKLTMVWWMPPEFWNVVGREDPHFTEEMCSQLTKAMDGYLIFGVVAADFGPLGGLMPKDRFSILANTELLIGGKPVAPLTQEQMSSDMLNLTGMMKPALANMMGRFGKGMEFLVYPNPARGPKRIAASRPGSFSYRAFGNQFDWHLPLVSLLPPKLDEKTQQVFPGDYVFNPYTGDKLVVKPHATGEATNAIPTTR